MSGYKTAEDITTWIRNVVRTEMGKLDNYPQLFIPAKITSISGLFCDLQLSGASEVCKNIPINPSISVNINDEVWVVRLNYKNTDLFVIAKRVLQGYLADYNSSWVNIPSLSNGWVYYGSPYSTVAYMKNALNQLCLKGVIKNGTFNITTAIYSLPLGYRPAERRVVNLRTTTGTARLDIDTNGNIYLMEGTSNALLSFDGVVLPLN